MLERLQIEHKTALLALIAATEIFTQEEIDYVGNTFEQSQEYAIWLGAFDGDMMTGVAYCAPIEMTNAAWNVLMLMVHPDYQRQGIGKALMAKIASMLQDLEQRLLIVETSSTDNFQYARDFYQAIGYVQQGTIADYYDSDDHKVTYSKLL